MPFFKYQCEHCNNIGERLVVNCVDKTCQKCDKPIGLGDQTTSAYSGVALMSFNPYYDKGLGKFIDTRSERIRTMKERGLIEIGNETERMDRNVNPNKDFECGVTDDEFREGWQKAEAVHVHGADP